jgi:hypothetical protein
MPSTFTVKPPPEREPVPDGQGYKVIPFSRGGENGSRESGEGLKLNWQGRTVISMGEDHERPYFIRR